MVDLYPVVKVNEPSIAWTWKNLDLGYLVVRLQDLISPHTYKLNKTFYDIKQKGGVHAFLGFSGKIILSLVMKDKLIANFGFVKCVEVINTLKPDFYTTPDGETYEGEEALSWKEIRRCFSETIKLIESCPHSKPIGHVKGCTRMQIFKHITLFKMVGIEDIMLHTGDFFRNNSPRMKLRAKEYALQIRKHAKTLILYGMGSQKRLHEFSFADAYITFNHFVTAINGRKYVGVNQISYTGGYKPKIVRENLIEMIKNINNIKKQTKLIEGGVCPWVEEQEEQDHLILAEAVVPMGAI